MDGKGGGRSQTQKTKQKKRLLAPPPSPPLSFFFCSAPPPPRPPPPRPLAFWSIAFIAIPFNPSFRYLKTIPNNIPLCTISYLMRISCSMIHLHIYSMRNVLLSVSLHFTSTRQPRHQGVPYFFPKGGVGFGV